ncbi:hypothetical protein CDAR_451961 [Caerostris darwini]|uniref:Uncharacterized protein n=1 Tax=Caerostris darwini TaxID=1538125 RepID=A0AAV4WXD1_9ARAC|nr:hypothetical protein CDAR_451961 [Caerostris darwini]
MNFEDILRITHSLERVGYLQRRFSGGLDLLASNALMIINLEEIITKHNLLLLKTVTFITSYIATPPSNFKTITQPAKALVNSGESKTPLTPQRGSRVDTKGNYRGPPSPIQFPRELPRLLNEKTFPNSGTLITNFEEIITKPNLLLLKNVTFIPSFTATPSSNLETITQPAKPWSTPGTDRPPLPPARKPSGHKRNHYKTQSTLIEKRNFYNFLYRYPFFGFRNNHATRKSPGQFRGQTAPSHPSEEAEWTQKVITGDFPSPIQFPRELPRLLNEKTFPNSRS